MSLVRIGDVTEPVLSWNPLRSAQNAFCYIELSAVDQQEKRITAASMVDPQNAPSRARQLVKTGDVLVSTVRPNLNAVAIVDAVYDGATASTGFCVLRAIGGKLDASYLFHWVRTPQFVNEMVRLATGASYPAVSDRIVRASLMPLPSLSDQRRRAATLEKVQAQEDLHRAALNKLGQLYSSLQHRAFSGQL